MLCCEELTVKIGDKMIIDSIHMKADSKCFIGIVGPNGSGKSTLLKTLYRVLKPCGGSVFLEGEPLKKMSYQHSAQKIAVVAQQQHYAFDFTVEEMVMMGRAPHKRKLEPDLQEDYVRVDAALKKLNMTCFKKRAFGSLSGGEQQRIILARALVQETPYLILDEPTNHLDIKYQLQLLKTVKEMDITVIAALHDLNQAMTYCDYVYMMQDGKIVAEGIPEELLTPKLIQQVYEVQSKYLYDHASSKPYIVYT